jgi:hypothetical protein
MKRFFLLLLIVFPSWGFPQEKSETRELVGHLGSRSALLVLHSAQRPDESWRVTGEYLVLPNLSRRYLEGERSPELGVTTLKEGASAILFGHPATGELRGTYRGGVFKGVRYGPGGQERERFEFSEEFAPMDGYSAAVSCEAGDARYASKLAYTVEAGKVKSLEWMSQVLPNGHRCKVSTANQPPPGAEMRGGIRVTAGTCAVTLRDLGESVKVAAENCAAACGSEAYLEPLLVDRRGSCRLLRPDVRNEAR